MTLTESQIAELEAAEEGTTPLMPSMRVERADFDDGETAYEIQAINEDETEEMFVAFSTRNHTPALRAKFNAEFWVLAKTLLPALLAERREMKAQIEDLLELRTYSPPHPLSAPHIEVLEYYVKPDEEKKHKP